LLKEAEKQKIRDQNSLYSSHSIKKATDAATLDDEVINILKEIVRALIDYYTHDHKFFLKEFKGFELRKHQSVRIEDILQVFVDHHDHLTRFI
jgi:phosphate uptake regulator